MTITCPLCEGKGITGRLVRGELFTVLRRPRYVNPHGSALKPVTVTGACITDGPCGMCQGRKTITVPDDYQPGQGIRLRDYKQNSA
jgi:hypothetical protein